MLLLAVTIVLFPPTHYSRNIIVLSWICVIITVSLARVVVYVLQKRFRRHGMYVKNTLVLGAGAVGISCANKIVQNPSLGLHFVGFLDEKPSPRVVTDDYKVFDDYTCLEQVIQENNIQHMVVAFSRDSHSLTVELMERCRPFNVEFTVVPRLYEVFSSRIGIEHIRGLPVLGLKRSSLTGLQGMVKRIMDISISLVVLILLLPLLLIIALVIKLDSPGPVLYRQIRLGKNHREFQMLKFRSMKKDAEENGAGWSIPGDMRRTRVGRIIRPLGIDELPQLINVIKGEMSLVGPRPERPEHAERFEQQIPAYASRHRVRPGLTGWAQINGLRGDTDISERVEHDIYYIENWNPWLDVKILLKTILSFVDRDA
jgi:exopolysaccharide biosynthesis polyprenyl glycosylphosphotransferase